jgi:hypothetical protein
LSHVTRRYVSFICLRCRRRSATFGVTVPTHFKPPRFPGPGDLDGLPDFFRHGAGLPADVGGALEEEGEEDLDALTFGDGFDVPLDGLPDFFQQPGAAHAAPSDAAASELDDLGGITGISSGGEGLSRD